MSSKRYRLLKTLPDSIPGDIYIWNESQKAYYKDGNVLGSYWTAQYVENNTDWFEPIPDTPEATAGKPFEWTDELVKEFIIDRNNEKPYAPAYVDSYINKFKASKQSKSYKKCQSESIPEFNEIIKSMSQESKDRVDNFMKSQQKEEPIQERDSGKLYTKDQLIEHIIKSFEAAREISYVEKKFFNDHYEGLKHNFINCSKHKTPEKYIKTLNL